eukprot:scaffold130989_cov46-Attheya_sp.AAC.1
MAERERVERRRAERDREPRRRMKEMREKMPNPPPPPNEIQLHRRASHLRYVNDGRSCSDERFTQIVAALHRSMMRPMMRPMTRRTQRNQPPPPTVHVTRLLRVPRMNPFRERSTQYTVRAGCTHTIGSCLHPHPNSDGRNVHHPSSSPINIQTSKSPVPGTGTVPGHDRLAYFHQRTGISSASIVIVIVIVSQAGLLLL